MVQIYEMPAEPAALARHDYVEVFRTLCQRLQHLTGAAPETWRIVELGCGYTYPNVLLFPTVGAEIAGVDVLDAFARDGVGALYRSRRRAGRPPHRAAVHAVRTVQSAARYHRELARLAGRPLQQREARLWTYDGQHLPFPDASFDIAISNAVLEHVQDLPALAGEVARVLRPGGRVDMLWHNYYSFTGNHLAPELNRAHPWGHLTGEISAHIPSLNEATPDTIRQAFGRHLKVERIAGADLAHHIQGDDPGFAYEGEEFFTPELATRLARYPRELLLTRAFLLQASKA